MDYLGSWVGILPTSHRVTLSGMLVISNIVGSVLVPVIAVTDQDYSSLAFSNTSQLSLMLQLKLYFHSGLYWVCLAEMSV